MTTTMPTHHEINCETGEVTVREFTQEEYDAWVAVSEADAARKEEELAAAEAAAAAKASAEAKLAALGLTPEEIKAL